MSLQLALLAKAVLVALLGADLMFPGRHGKCGLLFMFAAIVTSLVCVFVEMFSACALISGMRPHLALYIMSTQKRLCCSCVIRHTWTVQSPAWPSCVVHAQSCSPKSERATAQGRCAADPQLMCTSVERNEKSSGSGSAMQTSICHDVIRLRGGRRHRG